MMRRLITGRMRKINEWVVSHYFQIALFNIFLILIFLLRSAGYFHPYLIISVNFIVLISLVMTVVLFGWRSREMFLIAILFWLFALFLKLVKIEIWAERTSIYVYQALVIGVGILIIEGLRDRGEV